MNLWEWQSGMQLGFASLIISGAILSAVREVEKAER